MTTTELSLPPPGAKEGGYLWLLDTSPGVYATMRAPFRRRGIYRQSCPVVLTMKKRDALAGAIKLRDQVDPTIFVAVVGLTGDHGDLGFSPLKTVRPGHPRFVRSPLSRISIKLFEDSPDPIASEDEVDVYARNALTVLLGSLVTGRFQCGNRFLPRIPRSTPSAAAIVAYSQAYPVYASLQKKLAPNGRSMITTSF